VYTTQHRLSESAPERSISAAPEPKRFDFSALLDPTLLQAARHIYRNYYEVHVEQSRRPLGVAIDRVTHRGQLVFMGKPILLPQECFVPITQIEA
jgi:hypothetical protein